MSSASEKGVMNELYDALLTTTTAVCLSMVSKKILRETLGNPESMKGTLNLALAVEGGNMILKWAQKKKYLPVDPFKG